MTEASARAHEPLLAVRSLSKRFTLRGSWFARDSRTIAAVDDVSFEIEATRTLALVGESGCGKSTTARLIVGLEKPDGGEIAVGGEPLAGRGRKAVRSLRRRVQMVFQDPYASLTPHFTIGTLLAEPLAIHGIASRGERSERIDAALAAVGLPAEMRHRYPHELSGGQRQRIGIARALSVGPDLIICDEPVSALDISIRSQIVNLLLDLQRDRGVAYLFISHDLDLVEHVSDEVAVMYLGRIVERAPTGVFFAGPLHPYSRALLASSPVADPRRRMRAAPITGEAGLPGTDSAGCAFRARCPIAIEMCATVRPALVAAGPRRQVACHRAGEG